MKELFLQEIHKKAGAHFTEIEGCLVPADYGNVKKEIEALNHHVAFLDRSYLGKIAVKGKDALDLLDRITTNDLHYLAVGTVVDTIFASPKGRLIDYCRVINTGEELILIGSFFKADHLIDWINRFIILEDVQVTDVSKEYIWLTILGPLVPKFIADISDRTIGDHDEATWLKIAGENVPALKNNNFRVPAYNMCFDQKNAFTITDSLIENLTALNGRLIGDSAFQIIRVESGMPDWGTEISQDYNPHEARLTSAISFTKGCFTGQEVIARLDTYDKIQKYLMIIELSEPITHSPPLEVLIDDESIGHVTSYAFDPVSKRSVGLGYVKKMYAFEDNIYVDVFNGHKRIPARLKLPPQAYADK